MKIEPISTELHPQLIEIQKKYAEALGRLGISENMKGTVSNSVESNDEAAKHIYKAYLKRLGFKG